ncbi:MAG TPA: hypothetical protein VL128_16455 [Candidatus Eisenbacteria bacterium]|nr:hypothetical protein [Candidatus Eisenbacteria bacterium]
MSRATRLILIAMCGAFGICVVGLVFGMAYDLFQVFAHHRPLESVLGNSIAFYKTLGAFGILGFLLFFVFLISSIAGPNPRTPPK